MAIQSSKRRISRRSLSKGLSLTALIATFQSVRPHASRCCPGAYPMPLRPTTTALSFRRRSQRWLTICGRQVIAPPCAEKCISLAQISYTATKNDLPPTSTLLTSPGHRTGSKALPIGQQVSACVAWSKPGPACVVCKLITMTRLNTTRYKNCMTWHAYRMRHHFS